MTADAANGDSAEKFPFRFNGRVTYDTPDDADMVCKTLAVDAELRPEQVERKLTTDGRDFVMRFQAVDARTLRAAVGTFCDLLALATRSIETFGDTRKQ